MDSFLGVQSKNVFIHRSRRSEKTDLGKLNFVSQSFCEYSNELQAVIYDEGLMLTNLIYSPDRPQCS